MVPRSAHAAKSSPNASSSQSIAATIFPGRTMRVTQPFARLRVST